MSSTEISSNSRIARNTLMLYIRMIFLTLVSLYTVRETLRLLGAMDYGIYNVVANVIASMNFLMATMSSATQRFLAFHLGKRDMQAYSKAFSMLLWGFIALSLIIIIIGEIIGPIFINDILNIPPDKLSAAKKVFQFTIISFVGSLMTVPYNAQIVANERMGVFAWFSIADAVMRLGIVMLLFLVEPDRLVFYAGLLAVQSWIVWLIYFLYCRFKFPFCKVTFVREKALAKELGAYTGWNLFGTLSGMLILQGQAILLNIFFGPLVNTAKSIGDKIYSTVINFSVNFFMAVSPQIVKAFAAGDHDRMISLGIKSSKISFFLLCIISFPLICTMPEVLDLWLGESEVSVYMIGFARLLLIYSLIVALEPPLSQMVRATGKIKKYQVSVGIWTLAYIPIATVVLWLGGGPTSTLLTLIGLYLFVMIIRVRIVHKLIGLSYSLYCREVAWPLIRISAILAALYLAYQAVLPGLCEGFGWFCLHVMVLMLIATGFIWITGINRQDRDFIIGIIRRKL